MTHPRPCLTPSTTNCLCLRTASPLPVSTAFPHRPAGLHPRHLSWRDGGPRPGYSKLKRARSFKGTLTEGITMRFFPHRSERLPEHLMCTSPRQHAHATQNTQHLKSEEVEGCTK
ncbi:hypothetical protein E2C01_066094 [Portunus trituberculatus]|uniref:Uncharacterized protein n=1 Tax=Portunus trituberculatus TaxID=210409 RepID=A0A5B7HTK5_PORTR|nr:hypothetical protein [Portunus trituberculatus]